MSNRTTITITTENWQKLNSLKEEPGESFNQVVGRLVAQE